MTTGRRGSLATRIVLVCVAVAGVAVLVAGLVMAGLARRSAQGVLQDSLAAQADVLASQVDERGLGSRAAGLGRAAEVVRGQGIVVVILLPRRGIQPVDQRSADAARAAGLTGINGGQRISTKVSVSGQEYLVEARGVGPRSGFALVEPLRMPAGAQRILVRNILLALGAGLLVAALAGGLLGRLLARPLRRTADVAGAMRQGRRDLHVPVEGPAEVAEVAEAVNELSVALRHSEERQREFLLSVSHELRTPLTAVHGFAESLADGVVTGPEAQHAGQVIQQESQRLERLVSDLLDLARLGADQFRLDVAEVDLRETISACAEVWRVRCERQGVHFRLELPSTPAVATTDARRIRQVLDGLAENALRVTPAGSQLTLALDASRPGTLALQVRDGGPGLAPEDYAVAFERGVLHEKYRGRRPVGSGIGLALAFGLVARLGGTMTAGPAPEGGATFTVWLPAT
ncbi:MULTISPECIES: sensor histidine kinase [unclassified Kribbella]|uniref:sensor histidine kinase n=1 Tax=unclassified Kribbella TaxID=2644121 RepID=UPI0030775342